MDSAKPAAFPPPPPPPSTGNDSDDNGGGGGVNEGGVGDGMPLHAKAEALALCLPFLDGRGFFKLSMLLSKALWQALRRSAAFSVVQGGYKGMPCRNNRLGDGNMLGLTECTFPGDAGDVRRTHIIDLTYCSRRKKAFWFLIRRGRFELVEVDPQALAAGDNNSNNNGGSNANVAPREQTVLPVADGPSASAVPSRTFTSGTEFWAVLSDKQHVHGLTDEANIHVYHVHVVRYGNPAGESRLLPVEHWDISELQQEDMTQEWWLLSMDTQLLFRVGGVPDFSFLFATPLVFRRIDQDQDPGPGQEETTSVEQEEADDDDVPAEDGDDSRSHGLLGRFRRLSLTGKAARSKGSSPPRKRASKASKASRSKTGSHASSPASSAGASGGARPVPLEQRRYELCGRLILYGGSSGEGIFQHRWVWTGPRMQQLEYSTNHLGFLTAPINRLVLRWFRRVGYGHASGWQRAGGLFSPNRAPSDRALRKLLVWRAETRREPCAATNFDNFSLHPFIVMSCHLEHPTRAVERAAAARRRAQQQKVAGVMKSVANVFGSLRKGHRHGGNESALQEEAPSEATGEDENQVEAGADASAAATGAATATLGAAQGGGAREGVSAEEQTRLNRLEKIWMGHAEHYDIETRAAMRLRPLTRFGQAMAAQLFTGEDDLTDDLARVSVLYSFDPPRLFVWPEEDHGNAFTNARGQAQSMYFALTSNNVRRMVVRFNLGNVSESVVDVQFILFEHRSGYVFRYRDDADDGDEAEEEDTELEEEFGEAAAGGKAKPERDRGTPPPPVAATATATTVPEEADGEPTRRTGRPVFGRVLKLDLATPVTHELRERGLLDAEDSAAALVRPVNILFTTVFFQDRWHGLSTVVYETSTGRLGQLLVQIRVLLRDGADERDVTAYSVEVYRVCPYITAMLAYGRGGVYIAAEAQNREWTRQRVVLWLPSWGLEPEILQPFHAQEDLSPLHTYEDWAKFTLTHLSSNGYTWLGCADSPIHAHFALREWSQTPSLAVLPRGEYTGAMIRLPTFMYVMRRRVGSTGAALGSGGNDDNDDDDALLLAEGDGELRAARRRRFQHLFNARAPATTPVPLASLMTAAATADGDNDANDDAGDNHDDRETGGSNSVDGDGL